MFSTGASGLVNEYTVATITTYILGNSIRQFSVVISLMMLMMGISGFVQKFIKDQHLVEKFVLVEVLLALFGASAPIGVYAAFALLPEHFLLVLYFYVMIIGFLIGFEIPLIIRLNEKYASALKANLAVVLGMDYVGSFVGAIIWIEILLKNFPLTEISYLVAGSNFIIAVITALYFIRRGLVQYKLTTLAMIGLTAAIQLYGFSNNPNWSVYLEQKLYNDPIVLKKTTRYQHLVVTRNPTLDEYRLFINGNLQFSSTDEAIYHENLVHPAMSLIPDHANVLILGGGDGLALREVLKYPEVKQVTLVDLDPEMVKLAANDPTLRKLNQGAFDDARLITHPSKGITEGGFKGIHIETGKIDEQGRSETERVATVQVMNIDADQFLNMEGYYNVIIIDFPDPSSIELAKLYSKEFYLKLKRKLSKNGMLVVQSTSPYFAKNVFLSIQATLEEAGFPNIPYHENVPSFGDWGWFLAWNSGISVEQRRGQIEQLQSFSVATKHLTPEVFKANLVFGKGLLTASPQFKNSLVNTLMHPTILSLYLDASWKHE